MARNDRSRDSSRDIWRYTSTRQVDVVLVATGVLVAVAVAALAILVVRRDSDSRPFGLSKPLLPTHFARPSPAPTPPATAAALAWCDRNIAKREPILAARDLARRLGALGYSGVTDAPGSSVSWVVIDAEVRREATTFDVAGALQRAVPVAVFGTGNTRVIVASVVSTTSAPISSLVTDDRAVRAIAGGQLAVNPRVRVAAGSRELLRTGELDQRAATFLAYLATQVSVRVDALPQDAAETTAGRARRTLMVSLPAATIRRFVPMLPPLYRPVRILASSAGTTTVVWSAAFTSTGL